MIQNLKHLNNFLYKMSGSDDQQINEEINGRIFKIEVKDQTTKKRKSMRTYYFYVTDLTSSVILKATIFDMDAAEKNVKTLDNFKVNDYVSVAGAKAQKNKYTRNNDWNLEIMDGFKILMEPRSDLAKVGAYDDPKENITPDKNRVEFLTKTKFSTQDGLINPAELVSLTNALERPAFVVCDTLSSQAFPEVQLEIESQEKNKTTNIPKPIFATTLTTQSKTIPVVENTENYQKDFKDINNYVVYDIETTGLSPIYNEIIEIGAVKYVDGKKQTFQSFVKPTKPIPKNITELTKITDEMVTNAPSEAEVLQNFLNFIGEDKIIAGHNILNFDNNFINAKILKNKIQSNFNKMPKLDTLQISRAIFKQRSHKLEKFCAKMGVIYDSKVSHRADYDAEVNMGALDNLLNSKVLPEADPILLTEKFDDLNKNLQTDLLKSNSNFPSSCAIYLRSQKALPAFNQLLSKALTTDFRGYNSPRIFEDNLFVNQAVKDLDILVTNGVRFDDEVFQTAFTKPTSFLRNVIKKYHFISLPPVENFALEFETGITTKPVMESIYRRIVKLCIEMDAPIIVVSNASYKTDVSKPYYDALTSINLIGGRRHSMFREKTTTNLTDPNNPVETTEILETPSLSVKTTTELQKSFAFLKNEFPANVIDDMITTNTLKLADKFENIKPMKRGLFTPEIEGCAQSLTDSVWKQAHNIYGEKLPEIVEARLKRELDSILKHHFEVVYWISHLLVKKSNADGYIVGSRGSVGSSLVATMLGITEVNALPPHHICPNCKNSDFTNATNALSGFDMPPMNCAKCDTLMLQDGHDIPFETFLGFDGDKVPDIDLNFSGEYQAIAHNFLKDYLGEDKVFRAGTIGTLAEKTSVNETKKYLETKTNEPASSAECERLGDKLVGVKKTTGQHPGGVIVVPQNLSIYDFTPINFPADDTESTWFTTHNEFSHVHDNLLKFDILGHDDPTLLYHLQKMTGINPTTIPMNDPTIRKEVLSEFNANGYGLPEFGTKVALSAVGETNPQTFADLTALSGLLHGTDVYMGNIRDLILKDGKTLAEVPSCRDNIMVDLIKKGVPNKQAFDIMEHVRKGKSLTSDEEKAMREFKVDESYIQACKKIKYMFPKAHAAAYVLSAYRIAYFKKNHPEAFYAAWLSFKKGEFDLEIIKQGVPAIRVEMERINGNYDSSAVEKASVPTFEVVIEMLNKGIQLLSVDLNKSSADEFIPDVEKHTLLPPLSSIKGLGDKVAQKIKEERRIKPFENITDLKVRTKINKSQLFSLVSQKILPQSWVEEFIELFLTGTIMNKTDLKKVLAGDLDLFNQKYSEMIDNLLKVESGKKLSPQMEILKNEIFTPKIHNKIIKKLTENNTETIKTPLNL